MLILAIVNNVIIVLLCSNFTFRGYNYYKVGDGVYKIACIGNRIRERRLKLNLTLENLAEKTDLTQNFIGNIERGNDNPSLETLIKIANALAVNADYLCQDCIENAEAKEYDYYIKETIDRMTNMSEKQKELVIQSIDALMHFSDAN